MYGQLLLFCDQRMREKAWRSRKRGAQATRALHPACGGGRRASRSDTLAASQAFERMHTLWLSGIILIDVLRLRSCLFCSCSVFSSIHPHGNFVGWAAPPWSWTGAPIAFACTSAHVSLGITILLFVCCAPQDAAAEAMRIMSKVPSSPGTLRSLSSSLSFPSQLAPKRPVEAPPAQPGGLSRIRGMVSPIGFPDPELNPVRPRSRAERLREVVGVHREPE
jgi:hypothetical protein